MGDLNWYQRIVAWYRWSTRSGGDHTNRKISVSLWAKHIPHSEPTPSYDAAYDLAEAIRLTVEYVGNDMLPAVDGWSWFDALKRYDPSMARQFEYSPIHFKQPYVSLVTKPWLFRGRSDDPSTLSEVIGQGIGAGSACWNNLAGAGTFESDRAKTIVDEILNWIQENYIPISDVIPKKDLEPCFNYEDATD